MQIANDGLAASFPDATTRVADLRRFLEYAVSSERGHAGRSAAAGFHAEALAHYAMAVAYQRTLYQITAQPDDQRSAAHYHAELARLADAQATLIAWTSGQA